VFFSKPVRGVDTQTFTLTDSKGNLVPSWVDQIGEGTFGLFANSILLKAGETYSASLKAGVCDTAGNCTTNNEEWKFTVAPQADQGQGDTSVPSGFPTPLTNAVGSL